jgi:hypothetical protein
MPLTVEGTAGKLARDEGSEAGKAPRYLIASSRASLAALTSSSVASSRPPLIETVSAEGCSTEEEEF